MFLMVMEVLVLIVLIMIMVLCINMLTLVIVVMIVIVTVMVHWATVHSGTSALGTTRVGALHVRSVRAPRLLMVVVRMCVVVPTAMPVRVVLVVVAVVGGRVRMLPFLHLQQVQVGDVVVLVMLELHHLHFAQAQAQQQVLEAAEAEPVVLAIVVEELLDVVALFRLRIANPTAAAAAATPCCRGLFLRTHVWRLRYLQVAVDAVMIVIVPVIAPTVAVAVAVAQVATSVPMVVVPIAVAMTALVKQEGEHTEEAEFGVCMDPHLLLTSRCLHFTKTERKKKGKKKKEENILHIQGLHFFQSQQHKQQSWKRNRGKKNPLI